MGSEQDFLGLIDKLDIHGAILAIGNNWTRKCIADKIADILGHNFGPSFFSRNGIRKISNVEDLVQLYEGVFDSTDVKAIFFRPLALNGGRGCFKLDRDNISQQLKAEYKNLMNGDYTHTEAIVQHPEIDSIYDKSINTLRILTHLYNGHVDIVSSLIRIGAGGGMVDNASSGGLFIGIDTKTGILNRTGYKDVKFGGEEFGKHPDSGFSFENFQVPYFKEACELAKEAVRHIPDGFIGWDIALTPTGPTIIEGNDRAALYMSDVAEGGLLKNPLMQKVIARI